MEEKNSKAVKTENHIGNTILEKILTHKTSRQSGKHKHHSNRKKELTRQLEFYFSDINILNDKFLRNLISSDNDKGVDINVILSFNKVKEILSGIDDQESKINLLKKSVDHSKKLKFFKNKILRREKFELNKLDQKEIDKKSIYVENVPNDVTHDVLYKLFTRYGKVLHISIPKYSETKKSKGFVFIIFDSEENAEKAKKECNNSIPKEIFSLNNTNGLQPLSIISKQEWLVKKEEFKKLKYELMKENKDLFVDCIRQDSESINTLTENTLVKLTDFQGKKVDKYGIQSWISHFVEPAYVDYDKNENFCVVRFAHPYLAQSFVNKVNNETNFYFNGKKPAASLIIGEEEKIYFEKVRKLKEEFQRKKKNKNKINK